MLGYALQNITGKNLNTTLHSSVFDALGMKHSSYEAIPSSGVIPGDPDDVQWTWDSGPENPSGSVFMSTAGMVTLCQAIMQSTLLAPEDTRRWMKPMGQTGYLGSAVGAPWEIRYMPSSVTKRTIQYYTKQGDLNGYHAAMVLSPEHELGWVVLTAGPSDSTAPDIRVGLMDAFNDLFIPAAERRSRVEAQENFSGKCVDKESNSSVTITAEHGEEGRPGLGITSLISRGATLIGEGSPLVEMYHAGTSGRLYPTTLKTISKKKGLQRALRVASGFPGEFFQQDGHRLHG